MAYMARIECDSVNPDGTRLTTMVVTYPRIVHAELMTHRVFSRNAASSRAIPIEKMIRSVKEDPFIPVWWGKAQSGMQAQEELSEVYKEHCRMYWLDARDEAVKQCFRLNDLGLHKQIANRLLEPWSWITVVITATEWRNFFTLRCHPDAQPELQKIAWMMREVYNASTPKLVTWGEWHLPFYKPEDDEQISSVMSKGPFRDIGIWKAGISAARCARVSYLTHDGIRSIDKDMDLHARLLDSRHMSPFEHPAKATVMGHAVSNFAVGWEQYRKMIPNESGA